MRLPQTSKVWPLSIIICAAPALWAAPVCEDLCFADIASQVGIDVVGSYGGTFPELAIGPLGILQRNQGNGAAVGDYDGDGDLDIYLLGQLDHPNRLFRNRLMEDGFLAFSEVAQSVLGDSGHGRVAHFVDLDRDGHRDLVIVNDDNGAADVPPSRLLRNLGDGTFVDVTASSGFRPLGFIKGGCAIADYDGDGLLDIFVTVWARVSPFTGSNRLFRNLGGFRFEDVTESTGVGTENIDSFTAIFTDFNGDHLPDLFVAVDHEEDLFYRNLGGSFILDPANAGALHGGNDMGIAPADFDGDDDLDLYSTNITDPTGAFGTGQGNVLYVQQQDAMGQPLFIDEAFSQGVEDTFWGWGVEWADVDNDAQLDLAVATGFDEWVDQMVGSSSPVHNTPGVIFHRGAAGFERKIPPGFDALGDSRALIAFDADRDGDLDFLITQVDQPVRLLRNDTPGTGHWLTVALAPDHLALGARVYATAGGQTQRQDVIAGRSYLSGTPQEAHFGLGSADKVDTLRVVWADGSESIRGSLAADQMIQLEAGLIFQDGFEGGDLSAW